MDKNAIKKYAVWAREELIKKVKARAVKYEVVEGQELDDSLETIGGEVLSETEKKQRKALIRKIKADGYSQVLEEVAYTWFNRIVALRFMEVNGYLPSHVRVFSDETGAFKPQILTEAIHLDLAGLDMNKVMQYKEDANDEELFKYLLKIQCNALNDVLPLMFQKIEDYTELLLPDSLLREGSVIEKLVNDIPEDNFDVKTENGQIEVIGWMYQYYISVKHEEVVDPLHGKIIEKEEVPAATQLFTTDWVVRYLIDNSVGRFWIERNPESKLADELTYFVKPKDGVIKTVDEKVTPQEVTVFDPCVGSGHFLVYAFEVLMKIYVEYGYSERDAASEIVKNNLFGLDIDGRASQLAYFAVMMKARQYDRRFLTKKIQPNIYEILESNSVDRASVEYFCGNDPVLQKDVEALLDTFVDAKEYGSILQMPEVDFAKINGRFDQLAEMISMYNTYLLGEFKSLISPANLMGKKYAVVATNPPYLNKYDAKLKKYIVARYKDYSGNLFSVFIYKNMNYCIPNGYLGYMTPFVWMFIKTYEKLREYIIRNKSIVTLIQFEYSAFEEATVPICSFVLNNKTTSNNGLYFRLSAFTGGMDIQREKMLQAQQDKDCGYYYEIDQNVFLKIAGMPIAYRATEDIIYCYDNYPSIEDSSYVKKGMFTGQNDLFFRRWYEPAFSSIDFNIVDKNDIKKNHYVPMNSGGAFRRWYGNREKVIKFDKTHYDLITQNKGHRNPQFYFKRTAAWTKVTSGKFSIRISEPGFINNDSSMAVYENDVPLEEVVGLLNSSVAQFYLSLENESLNYTTGNIASIPMKSDSENRGEIIKLVKDCVNLSKEDWDSSETSWDFEQHPLVKYRETIVASAYKKWEDECNRRFFTLKNNEEKLNAYYINNYGLEKNVNSNINESDITVSKANLHDNITGLISYSVGCMFGRYSLDEPGLAYAGGAWDSSKYIIFKPDDDAIIPICDDEYFEDDIVGRFIQFVEIAYGKNKLEDNLQFIADALGGSGSAREVIRKYFINNFYKDHVKMYHSRPIYWLFDAGENNGFKCLVYMHRYQPDTLARIRTDYIHEQQARYRTAIEETTNRLKSVSGTEKVKLTKKLNTLKAKDEELHVYEEKIHHLADQMISIDLDDGVKHNYALFKDVLAKIK